MSALRILFAINTLARGGAERITLDICRELQKRLGVDQLLVVFSDENNYPELSDTLNIKVCRSSVYLRFPNRTIADVSEFQKIAASFQPDIIHTHLFYADQVSREILFPEVQYFSHVHGRITQYEPLKWSEIFSKKRITDSISRKKIRKKYEQCNNQFIANSSYIQQYVMNSLKIKPERVHLLENSVDLDHFRFFRRSYPQNQIRLITTGSLISRKNHLLLLDVIENLKNYGKDVQLAILGEGPLRQKILNRIHELHLENCVVLKGELTEIATELHQADVYVHSATYEPFGLAIVEALATGLPVVCLDAKGNRGIVDNGVNGFMIEKQDPELFAKKILAVVKDESTYANFSLNAANKAKQYDIKTYVDKLLLLYEQVLSER